MRHLLLQMTQILYDQYLEIARILLIGIYIMLPQFMYTRGEFTITIIRKIYEHQQQTNPPNGFPIIHIYFILYLFILSFFFCLIHKNDLFRLQPKNVSTNWFFSFLLVLIFFFTCKGKNYANTHTYKYKHNPI